MIRLIRILTALTVAAVAAFAAVVSYSHIYDLDNANGQFGSAARLLPLSIDGLIVAASLVLLEAALSGRAAPVLARAMLWAGVAATLGANAAYGRSWGLLGILVSTVPAASFVGAVEMAFGMVRSAHRPAAPAQDGPEIEPAGDPPSARELARQIGVSRRQAARLLGQEWAGPEPVSQSGNGQQPV